MHIISKALLSLKQKSEVVNINIRGFLYRAIECEDLIQRYSYQSTILRQNSPLSSEPVSGLGFLEA